MNRYIGLNCRYQPERVTEYRLTVYPGSGQFELTRWDGGGVVVPLVRPTFSRAIRLGFAKNQFELRCVGDTISASINGVTVATVTDRTYSQGQLRMLVGTPAGVRGTVEALFDNLMVSRP
jgi:hypothetical protein